MLTPVPPDPRREAWKMRTLLKFEREGFLTFSTRATVRCSYFDFPMERWVECVTFASEWHGDAK